MFVNVIAPQKRFRYDNWNCYPLKVVYAILHRNSKCANFCRVILKGPLQIQQCFLKHETKGSVIFIDFFIQDFEMLTFVRKNGINRAVFIQMAGIQHNPIKRPRLKKTFSNY